MDHGFVEVAAYQETLLIMTIFGIAMLAMLWVGFRRWLQHKEKMDRLFAEKAAERSAQFGAQMERVEARLTAMEGRVGDGRGEAAAEIEDAPATRPTPIG